LCGNIVDAPAKTPKCGATTMTNLLKVPATDPSPPQPRGISSAQAAERLKSDGYNELPQPARRHFGRLLWDVLRQPMFLLLIGGGVVYLLLGDLVEALLLIAFASLSVAITIIQESRSEKVLQALRNLASPRARVLRDGKVVLIAGREVVCGDLLLLSEGDRVAADGVAVSANELRVDESLLTGESIAVGKQPGSDAEPGPMPVIAAGGDDSALLFAGTLVVRGSGQVLVRATGAATQMGQIGRALGGITTEQPQLQRQLAWLVRDFAIAGALIGTAVVLLYGLLRGTWLEAMLAGIALGMSLLPEEFPLVMTVFMAMGAWRISQARVLTRRAAAIETLGATTVLCTDKTGTLTENQMQVVQLQTHDACWHSGVALAPGDALAAALEVALLASAQQPTDPMDIAVHRLAAQSAPALLARFTASTIVRAYGLRPDLPAFVNVIASDASPAASLSVCAKGGFEAIATLCQLPQERVLSLRQQLDTMASAGLRVLALARTEALAPTMRDQLPATAEGFAFSFVGLIGFADPVRASVPDAVKQCQQAGIRVVMITGDYPATALAIARQAGIITATEGAELLTGAEISQLNDSALAQKVGNVAIYARIRPEQKLRIVQALKANKEVVAMTGDGVNDAPAIKAAHIGIAMGARGTDVAREAAAIVLLDDDFAAIVKTIRLGRRIYDNLRKAIEYIVSVHIPIAGLALLPLLMGLPLILTPILIAFLEMVIDPACSIVFEAEREERDVMQRPPRDSASPLLLPQRIWWAVVQGVIVLAIVLAILVFADRAGTAHDALRALVFTALVVLNVVLILVNRSNDASLLQALTRPNRALLVLLAVITSIMTMALLWSPVRELFHFAALSPLQLGLCALGGILGLLLLETLKFFWFRTGAHATQLA
jgi:P-type Ca2+ transporter type 2C